MPPEKKQSNSSDDNFDAKKVFTTSDITTMDDDEAYLIAKKNNPRFIQPTRTPDQKKKNIQRGLAEVYTDGDGEIPDLSKLENGNRPLWKTILYTLIVILIVLFSAAAAGFYIFNNLMKGDSFTNENVLLKIQPPLTLVSGADGDYVVTITNKEKVNLYDLKLQIIYPDSFVFGSADPKPMGDGNNIWNFSILKAGESLRVNLKGKAVASLSSALTFRADLDFKPADLNATYRQEAIIDLTITSSIIGLSVIGPETALSKDNVEYDIKYQNTGIDDLSDLQIVVDYPAGFIFGSSTPIAQAGNSNTWVVDKLKASSTGEIKIGGNYSATEATGNQEFKVRVQLKNKGDYYPQSEQSVVTNVIKDQLSLQLIANGSAQDQPINFGDMLIYSINFKNTGQDIIQSAKVVLTLDSQIVDWDTLADEHRGVADAGKGTITWTGRNVPQLLKLAQGEEGTISVSVRLKDFATAKADNVSKYSVESSVEATGAQASGISVDVKSNSITNAINSDLTFVSGAKYYNSDNIALGLGPITPKNGEVSSYNIEMNVGNNIHDISDGKVVITLPKGVAWANNTSADRGDIVYNSKTNQAIWAIGDLAKSNGLISGSFNVSIQPTSNDVGKVLLLVSDATLTAKDGVTGATMKKSVKAITTAFEDPILGQLGGMVE